MDRAAAAHCAGGQLSGGLVRIVTAAPAAAAFSNVGRTAFTWNLFRDGLTIRMSLAAPFRFGRKSQLVAAGHCLRQQAASQPAGVHGGNRFREEKSDMGPVPRTGAFHGGGDVKGEAGVPKGGGIFPPRFFIKVNRQKPGSAILQHGVDPNHIPAERVPSPKVCPDNACGQGQEGPAGAIGALARPFVANPWLPLVLTGGDIAALSGFQVVVTSGVEVFPSPEQGEEKRGLLLRGAFGANGGGRFRRGWSKSPLGKYTVCRPNLRTGQMRKIRPGRGVLP